MRLKRSLSLMTTTLTLAALMMSAMLVAAQDTAEAAPTPAAEIQGVGTLFLLLGLAAIGFVSLVWLARERTASNETTDVA